MADYWWWLILALALGVAEMLSGTVYMLLIAGACVVGALAAWLGAGLTAQITLVSVVGVVACVTLARMRASHGGQHGQGASATATARDDDNLDVGNQVEVMAWREDGTTQVRYRGSHWSAIPDVGAPQRTGLHVIVRVDGNRLVLRPAAT